jgi:hypothetical protein
VKTGISKGVTGPIEESDDSDLAAIRSVCCCSNNSRFVIDRRIRRSGFSIEFGCSVLSVLSVVVFFLSVLFFFDTAEVADDITKREVGWQLLLAAATPQMPHAGHQCEEEVNRLRFGTHRLCRWLHGFSGEGPLRNAGYQRSAANQGVGPSDERRSRYRALKTAG